MRRARAKQAVESVSGYLSADHERLLAILDGAARRVGEREFGKARACLARFEAGLRRHMDLEERVLFPVFDVRTGLSGGPTTLLRDEHREILHAVDLMGESLIGRDAAAFRDAFAFFSQAFAAHTTKEHRFLFSAVDRMLSDAERSVVSARLQQS